MMIHDCKIDEEKNTIIVKYVQLRARQLSQTYSMNYKKGDTINIFYPL